MRTAVVTPIGLPPMPDSVIGETCTVCHAGSTAAGEIIDTSAKESGPTVMRVGLSDELSTKELKTPTLLIEVCAADTTANSVWL